MDNELQSTEDSYFFFWKGNLSQWAKSPFSEGEIEYCTAEQYMMYHKAILFNDLETAQKILKTRNPRDQQAFGRQVAGYVQEIWDEAKLDIVIKGNMLKFTQNLVFQSELLATGDALLVEASPVDKIWGIGLDAEAAAKIPRSKWPGENKLGIALTIVRERIRLKVL